MGTISMITSGKDGVGKSTISIFLADAIEALGKRVLIIELDTGLRSLDIMSGAYGSTVFDIFDVLSGRCTPGQAIVHAPSPRKEIYLLSAPYKNERVQGEQFVKLVSSLSEQFDHVIIDAANHAGSIVAASAVSMNAIVVATPDPLSVRDARIMTDRLRDLSVPNIRLLINRVVPSRIHMGLVPNLDYCIDSVGARLIGVITEEDDIALSAAGGRPIGKKNPCRVIFDNIAQRIYGNDVPLAIE
ncbi:MAG: AAA family ATPase [Oscillospiraceae bacterium]